MQSQATSLKGKTLFITGASRGIGKAIALRAARDGANIVIAAKTTDTHPALPGTIFSAAGEIEAAGGKALAVATDVRFEDQIVAAFDKGAAMFGGIDIVVNNASAISLTGTSETHLKRYDLMHQVNTRGTFLCSKVGLRYLRSAANPHILNISPPLNMSARWFAPHVAYTMAKYGMSMCVLGMAEEFRSLGIAVNALWPRTAIATAAVQNVLGGDDAIRRSRVPEIMADCAHIVLTSDSRTCTGNFFIDDELLLSRGINDLSRYAVDPSQTLQLDFFLDEPGPSNAVRHSHRSTLRSAEAAGAQP